MNAMRRRTFLTASATATLAAKAPSASASAAAAPPITPTLTARDPQASRNAQAAYAFLVASENAARAGYPGADRVDIVAVDDYNAKYGAAVSTPENQDFTNIYYKGLADYAKPRMLAETGNVPIAAPTDAAPATNALTASPWVIWSIWGDRLTASNSNTDVKATYYATSQVWTGGSGMGYGQNFNWGSIHAH
nr:hypothetical protein OH826_02640 [Streptomyces sp. NBC_00899]WSX81091.1 hypothetical protein OH826_48870 [Streptomyces sp. NBC_00899]